MKWFVRIDVIQETCCHLQLLSLNVALRNVTVNATQAPPPEGPVQSESSSAAVTAAVIGSVLGAATLAALGALGWYLLKPKISRKEYA